MPKLLSTKRARLSDESKTCRCPDINGETITVLVREVKTFHIHKTLLESSKFFQNAMKREWREGKVDEPITLPDTDPSTFEAYSQWLYSGNLPPRSHVIAGTNDPFVHFANAYVLGNELMDCHFQNVAMDALVTHGRDRRPGSLSVNIIYSGTAAGSPARRLMVDFWSFAKKEVSQNADFVQILPSDFVNDLIKSLLVTRERPPFETRPWISNPESYYVEQEIEGADGGKIEP